MKKVTLVLAVVALLSTACGNSNTSSEVTDSTSVDSVVLDSSEVKTDSVQLDDSLQVKAGDIASSK